MGRLMEGSMAENVTITENVDIDFWSDGTIVIDATYAFEENAVVLDRDEAIAAARAILKHFNCGMEE